MLAIYKRELKSYFRSFIGFLFIAVTLFFLGLYFSVYNLMNGYPYFAYVVSSVTFLFMLTVPILTMRILAEEKPKEGAKAAAPTLEDYYLYVFGDAESNIAVP